MTRWNDTIELLSMPALHQDASGRWVGGEKKARKAFCNPYTVGAEAWSTAVDMGLRADYEVQLRSCEYKGETEARYRGDECDVEKVTQSGDFTRLQLGRKASNE